MANHWRDPLTGLHTRAYVLAFLEDLIAHADGGERIGVIITDADKTYLERIRIGSFWTFGSGGLRAAERPCTLNSKPVLERAWTFGGTEAAATLSYSDSLLVNECFGHKMGDKMIIAMARAIETCIGPGHIAARCGGDEFWIVVPDYGAQQMLELAETIRERAATVTLEGYQNQLGALTLTLGLACFPDDGTSALELLEAADVALSEGKNRGKNCVVAARDLKGNNVSPSASK